MFMNHQLIASKKTGSLIAELAFAAADLPLDVRDIEWTEQGLVDKELLAKNPLAQVPTLILPDGSTLTESGAIVLYAQDRAKDETALVPAADDLRARTKFFQWLMIINAAIYPTFTYGDLPDRWIPGHPDVAPLLKETTDRHRERLWLRAEAAATGPWFLGDAFSAIDIYIYAMNPWRPRTAWFAAHAPKLTAIANRVRSDARFTAVIARQE